MINFLEVKNYKKNVSNHLGAALRHNEVEIMDKSEQTVINLSVP